MTTAAPYTDKEVTVRGLKLHYQEWGDPSKPSVLLVHGFGVSGHMFDEFGERARDDFHLIALDQRGHGDSDWASDGDYSRDAMVDDLEAFREAIGMERFVLVGHSMGGLNAVAYTVRHPERVKALVLVDVGPEAAKEGVDNIVRFTRGPDVLDFDEFVEMAHRFNPRRSIENIRERMRHRLKPTDDGKWTWKFDKRFREDRESLKVGSELSTDEMWALFRSVPVPTLIARGSESDVLTQEVAERAAGEMQRAALVVIPDAGHSVPGDNPEDFTTVVRNFIKDVEIGQFTPSANGASGPIDALVRVNESRQRRRPGIGTLAMLAGGALLAAVGGAYLFRKRRKKNRLRVPKRSPKVDQLHVPSLPNLDGTRERMTGVAFDLAGRARHLAQDVDVDAALQGARSAAGGARSAAGGAGERGRHAAETIDRRRLRKDGKRALRRGRGAVETVARRGKRRRRGPLAWLR
ncbi:MAG: alpha/beta hydrolase [Dehalococcoidia bacterium]|nr:alpha/beta hydrolase [Dehalococcoidia bacterium]